MVYTILDT